MKDLAASRAVYEKLGFYVFGGDQSQKWLIMKHGTTVIGLFQGMFEKNILTFNPGWDSNATKLAEFTGVREIQRRLKAHGVECASEIDEGSSGPASFTAIDPDGNPILVDQHVQAPRAPPLPLAWHPGAGPPFAIVDPYQWSACPGGWDRDEATTSTLASRRGSPLSAMATTASCLPSVNRGALTVRPCQQRRTPCRPCTRARCPRTT